MNPPFGLCYLYPVQNRLIALPLLGVGVESAIKDIAAQVKLTQTYCHNEAFPVEAIYRFPIPARAAVCSFAMTREDGTQIRGIVKEKQAARREYDQALSAGKGASLLEQVTPDVFQVSVGNIPPKEQIKVELIYATELTEDEESDSIRFHLPMHIGVRYGKPPLSPNNPFADPLPSGSSFVGLKLDIETVSPIVKIGSPSHVISTELGPDPALPNSNTLPFSNYARISASSDTPWDRDFVLTIGSAGLDAPRCVAEVHPTDDSVALSLSLVPRFTLPDVPRQEFIILVDRSGSMEGARMAAARKALIIMLRALPHQETLFQIVSFGTQVTSLWANSRSYNQETLEEATRHVDGMHANYGGTEIKSALEYCFARRKSDRQTSVLLLTDGDAWDVSGVLDAVKGAVAASARITPLRVSVLGIGESVSTAMCEGIARVGNGTCMLVGPGEASFTGKIARLLKATKSPLISDISVDWGRSNDALTMPKQEDFEMVESEQQSKLNLFDESIHPSSLEETSVPLPTAVVLAPPPVVQQSPFKINNLFPGTRLNIYAILQGKSVPKTVILRGSTSSGSEIELPISVTSSRLPNDPSAPSAIHALAARKLVQDLEDGSHELAKTIEDPDLLARTVNAQIARLGVAYSIASSQTSFVAVDDRTPEVVRPVEVDIVNSAVLEVQSILRGTALDGVVGSMRSRLLTAQPTGFAPPPPPPPPLARMMFAAPAPVPSSGNDDDDDDDDDDWEGMAEESGDGEDSDEEELVMERLAPSTSARVAAAAQAEGASRAIQDPLEALARMQSFDGGFTSLPALLRLVDLRPGCDAATVRTLLPVGASDSVVATIIAMAFLNAKLAAKRDEWEGMYEKAGAFVWAALLEMGFAGSVEELQKEAAGMLL
ncbi:hypothetical protein MIND_00134800 [Mycena indigotica]|uniref:Uncharacterized protein n=1 Tax=Mycena indigotica TaxID=2126181 RepID=A0A8H6TGC0_9AGAR|nr:uncharacterized protein MIND_00134800 [Mycena indigotica]KAF7316166.1 hypothetical protein MIND_00134800 [Mycena indigotica]